MKVAIILTALLLLGAITPDSPLYPIKKLIERLDIMLTFDDVAKVKKILEYAKEKLEMARRMEREGKMKCVEELLGEYEEYLKEAYEVMRSAKPKDARKISELIVKESLSNLKELEELGNVGGEAKDLTAGIVIKTINATSHNASIVEEIEEIVEEATNLSTANATRILERGLSMFRR